MVDFYILIIILVVVIFSWQIIFINFFQLEKLHLSSSFAFHQTPSPKSEKEEKEWREWIEIGVTEVIEAATEEIENKVTWLKTVSHDVFFLLNEIVKCCHNLSNIISVKCYKSTDDKNHHTYNCKLIMNKLQCYECWDSIHNCHIEHIFTF